MMFTRLAGLAHRRPKRVVMGMLLLALVAAALDGLRAFGRSRAGSGVGVTIGARPLPSARPDPQSACHTPLGPE